MEPGPSRDLRGPRKSCQGPRGGLAKKILPGVQVAGPLQLTAPHLTQFLVDISMLFTETSQKKSIW